MVIRLMLLFIGSRMVETLASLLTVAWQGEIDLFLCIIACDSEAKVTFTIPVL